MTGDRAAIRLAAMADIHCTKDGQGALAGYKEAKAAGVKLKKIWVCDSDPCPICEENQDAGEIEVEDDFPSGDDAETAHPSCLCHTESVVEDDSDVPVDNNTCTSDACTAGVPSNPPVAYGAVLSFGWAARDHYRGRRAWPLSQ